MEECEQFNYNIQNASFTLKFLPTVFVTVLELNLDTFGDLENM